MNSVPLKNGNFYCSIGSNLTEAFRTLVSLKKQCLGFYNVNIKQIVICLVHTF